MSQTAVVARAPSFNIRRTCRISMMYNLRKRKAPILGPFPKTAAAGGAQPHARGLSAPAEEGGSSAAAPSETEEDLDAASAAPAAPSPAKPKQWEDVGLKVDTSQLLLGMGPLGPSPTADAALMSSPAATAALARSGMSHETLQRGVDHLATADPSEGPPLQSKPACLRACVPVCWGTCACVKCAIPVLMLWQQVLGIFQGKRSAYSTSMLHFVVGPFCLAFLAAAPPLWQLHMSSPGPMPTMKERTD